jgi:hypothetical protein
MDANLKEMREEMIASHEELMVIMKPTKKRWWPS